LRAVWFSHPDWPLTSTAFWLQWQLWGAVPFGYHLVNFLLQIADAFLVWKLFARLGLRWAWLGGLLFVIHPLAVESVAWVSELKNTLSLAFLLLALLAWLEHDAGKGGYLRAVAWFLLALLSKTSVVMFPAVLILHAKWKHDRITRRDLISTAPFFLLTLVFGLVSVHFQADLSHESAAIRARGIDLRCFGAGASLAFYLGKFLWPFALMPVYPSWSFGPAMALSSLAATLLVVLLIALWFQRRDWSRHLLLGLGFFVLNLLPVIGLIDMTYLNFSPVADHFIYLPMIGLMGLVVLALEVLAAKCPARFRLTFLVLVAGSFGCLAWSAHGYAALFADEQAMWHDNVALNPNSWAAHNNLGYALLQSGRVREAAAEFDTALRLDPSSAAAHNNRGVVLLQTAHYAESIREFTTALQLDPTYRSARRNLQIARAKLDAP
jgi:tetratricopeptide (TPR) repeat protein